MISLITKLIEQLRRITSLYQRGCVVIPVKYDE